MSGSLSAGSHAQGGRMIIGLVTIGQSPRPDLLHPIQKVVGDSADLVLTGALDDLTHADVERLAPVENDVPLVTRMRDGQTVTVSHKGVVPLLQKRINEHQDAGSDLLVVLCTGAFPELSATIPMLMPDRILSHFVAGTFPAGRLGIIAPVSEQEPMMRRKWREYPNLIVEWLDPYGDGNFSRHTTGLLDCRLVVLDCMGYTNDTKSRVQSHLGVPVVVAQEVLASAVGLLV